MSTSPANAARTLRVFDSIDVSDLLQQVHCPTLVLHATGDLRVPFDEGRFIAGGIALLSIETRDGKITVEAAP